jgi:hypothetical protein
MLYVMVKLDKLPSASIIDGLFGVVDFYELHLNPESEKSIAIARAWPRYNPEAYPETSKVMQPYFRYISKMWSYLDPTVQQAYMELAESSSMAPRDYMTRCYINYKTV